MESDLDRILIDSSQIATRVKDVAGQIVRDMARPGEHPASASEGRLTIIPILTGSIIFLADLIRHMPMFMRVELISVSSYPGVHTTPGKLKILTDLHKLDLAGRDVLLVDDILDSGQTLAGVCEELRQKNLASLRTCVLLHKQRDTSPKLAADYTCFEIPDEFVVGYGLDFNDYYRNLPYIATLRSEAVSRHQSKGA